MQMMNKRQQKGLKEESRSDEAPQVFEERVIQIDRVARTVKGGRRIRFRALVVVGNRAGRIGIGIGKSQEVVKAIHKAVAAAERKMIDIPIQNDTFPYPILAEYGASRVFLKPAPKGKTIVAGGPVRAILELAGIKNAYSKILGSENKINNVKAVFLALQELSKRYKDATPRISNKK